MVEWKPLVGGALAGTVSHVFMNEPLSRAGLLYAWQIFDSEGRYVWGVGTGNILNAIIGGGLTLAGKYALKGKTGSFVKDFGIGWLLALGCIKLSEIYTYVGRFQGPYQGIWTWTLSK